MVTRKREIDESFCDRCDCRVGYATKCALCSRDLCDTCREFCMAFIHPLSMNAYACRSCKDKLDVAFERMKPLIDAEMQKAKETRA